MERAKVTRVTDEGCQREKTNILCETPWILPLFCTCEAVALVTRYKQVALQMDTPYNDVQQPSRETAQHKRTVVQLSIGFFGIFMAYNVGQVGTPYILEGIACAAELINNNDYRRSPQSCCMKWVR